MGRRAFVIVLDACGAGELPDSADYGDAGANTLGHVAEAAGGLELPNLQALGLGAALPLLGCPPPEKPALHGRLHPLGPGKDTITGHWELMGAVTPVALRTYPDGFPPEVIEQLRDATGRGILCNRPYSGTAVIDDYGEEHLRTGDLIVYTSADSVLQIAAHDREVPADRALRRLRGRAGDHARRARRRPRDRAALRRRAGRVPRAPRAARTSRSTRPAAPTCWSSRTPGCRCTPSGRSARCSTTSASTTSTRARPIRPRSPRRRG